jgi:hypothetical protein
MAERRSCCLSDGIVLTSTFRKLYILLLRILLDSYISGRGRCFAGGNSKVATHGHRSGTKADRERGECTGWDMEKRKPRSVFAADETLGDEVATPRSEKA